MKKLCKTCFYWHQRKPVHYLPKRVVCGDCSCEKFIYIGSPSSPYSIDSLLYWDAEGYDASFATGPEFGCVHWAKKD